jgi:polyisoprenoid-binding protein YceI
LPYRYGHSTLLTRQLISKLDTWESPGFAAISASQKERCNGTENDISGSNIDVDIDPASVNSNEPKRDEHLRNPDLLDVERFPSMHFRSTTVSRSSADPALVAGELTIHGVTRPVEFRVTELSPATKDPWGNVRLAAAATAKISRKDFGLVWNPLLETGGVLVGDDVFIDLDVEFVRSAE